MLAPYCSVSYTILPMHIATATSRFTLAVMALTACGQKTHPVSQDN